MKQYQGEFHEAFGDHINNCLVLGYQLDELVKNGFLKDYLVGSATTTTLTVLEEEKCTPFLVAFLEEGPLPLSVRGM